MEHTLERTVGSQTITLQTGKLAAQANGAVTVVCGDTVLLVTATMSDPRPNIDFLPLTIEFEEKLYAIGKIPGSFFRREGRPGADAVLSARLVDRPLRPQFPKGLRNDLQVVIMPLSSDRSVPPDILGIIGASAAVSISDIPFNNAVGASRVAYIDGEYIINPTYEQMDQAQLSVAVAGTRGSIGMVEAGASEVSESIVIEAIRKAQEANDVIVDMIDELVRLAGKTKQAAPPLPDTSELESRVQSALNGKLQQVLEQPGEKPERESALKRLEEEVVDALQPDFDSKQVASIFDALQKKAVRARILEKGIRPDGRSLNEIRPISSEVGLLPRAHGTGLFSRGLTQVLSIATLASVGMTQNLDTLGPQEKKRYMHHYNFPPYSTGETGRMFTGRREIGHGALAERALIPVLPSDDDFPYVLRVVSEVLSSNGSTSMASVCGSSLALMDAGVPLKAPVAGVAMGLIMGDDGKYAVLSDIQGVEDFFGDMDFKVAGTEKGINALQMDMKISGLGYDILEIALEQARLGRLHILDKMNQTISTHRDSLSEYAPKMVRINIPVDKIGTVIGPGGRMIRAIIEETGATIDIDDEGNVNIGATAQESIDKARQKIEAMTRELVVGDIFTGKVVRMVNFGAFVELVPGKDGLLRTEEMAAADNGVTMGQEITVMVQEIDNMGRINLSRRALFGEAERPRPAGPPGGRPISDRGPRRDGPSRGFSPGGGRPGGGRPPGGGGGGGPRPPYRPGNR